MNTSLIVFVIVFLFYTSTVTLATKQSTSTITFEMATRCHHDHATPQQLPPNRLALFYEGMHSMIKEYSHQHPEWFIGSTSEEQQDNVCRTYDKKHGKVLSTSSLIVNMSYKETPTNAVAECWEFLLRWMPEEDTSTLPLLYFMETIKYALLARTTYPVSSQVPWPLFLNEVLPYSVLSEPRDPWRPQFYEWFHKHHAGFFLNHSLTSKDAAQFLNEKAWTMDSPPIVFKPCGTDQLCQYSPFQVLRAGNSSCTGLAIFLTVSARSVGLPARLTGTPHWNLGNKTCPKGDASPDCGNHDWAETLPNFGETDRDNNFGWSFFDPDGDTRLNHSWFFPGWTQHQVPSTTNHSIFATSWASSTYIRETYGSWWDNLAVPHDYFPMVWNWTGKVKNISSAWDVTRRYLNMDPKKY